MSALGKAYKKVFCFRQSFDVSKPWVLVLMFMKKVSIEDPTYPILTGMYFSRIMLMLLLGKPMIFDASLKTKLLLYEVKQN